MARTAKKETVLTAEEKLAQALVPEAEQPYQVPENWCWAFLPALCEYMRAGGDKPENISDEKNEECQIPVIANGLQEDGIIGYTNIENEKAGTVTVSGRGTIGHAVVRDYSYYPVIRLIVLSPNKSILPEYLKFIFDNFTEEGTGTSIPQLTVPSLKSKPIPLPPLAEQQRIVNRIESLFAKLDEAKEKAQAVVDGFEDRKAAILHKAFTGELTKSWRGKSGYSKKQWTKLRLKDCGEWMGGGTPSMAHPEYWESGDVLWVTSKDMKSDLIEDTMMHTNMAGVSNSSANYSDRPSVLFVMRSGILRRTLPIAMVKTPFTVNQDLKAVAPDQIDLDYLFWVCESNEKAILNTCMKSGTTVESINAAALMEFVIPIAPREEQGVIVKTIVNLLEKEEQAKEAAEQVIDQIDTMKKAILARAFRGELGTNDPADESAEELLKRVL